MAPYWILWLLVAGAGYQAAARERWDDQDCVLIGLLSTLLIGLRYEVGGDWGNYFAYLDRQDGASLAEALLSSDPAYELLNWLAVHAGGGLTLVNLVCAALFSLGLVLFCRAQPRPWLALASAVPYLVIVVAMGYSRQGVAIGLAMPGLLALERGRVLVFTAWIAAAASFHGTALVLLVLAAPLLVDDNPLTNLLRGGLFGGAGLGLFNALLADRVESFQSGYIDAGYQSDGALIRVVMNLLPALLFLMQRHALPLQSRQRRVWLWLALCALAMAVLLVLSPSSTAIDRIGLYLIPLQLFVAARLPDAEPFGIDRDSCTLLLLAYSGAVLFVWLNFATHAQYWLPYRNLLWPF